MSIYIHIPFCNGICSYCDFCKIFYNKKYIKSYLDNLRNEIVDRYKGEEEFKEIKNVILEQELKNLILEKQYSINYNI